MAKIIKYEKGSVVKAPLGLTYNKKYEDELSFYEVFRMFRYLKFREKNPSIAKQINSKVKINKQIEFNHYAWEYELLEIIYSENTRSFNNECLEKLIKKFNRISNDIKHVLDFMSINDQNNNNTIPQRTFGNLLRASFDEKNTNLKNVRNILISYSKFGELDIKTTKGTRPREVLSLIYPVKLLTQIYNCIDWKFISLEHYNNFVYERLIDIPSLKDLNSITISNAINKSNDFTFIDMYLRSINNEKDLEKIRNLILR